MNSERSATVAEAESECARLLKSIMFQVSTPCFDNDPPDRQHPQYITMRNGDIRAARRAISKLEDAGAL